MVYPPTDGHYRDQRVNLFAKQQLVHVAHTLDVNIAQCCTKQLVIFEWSFGAELCSGAGTCADLTPTKNFMSVIPNNMGRRAAKVNVLCQQLFNCTKNFDCNVCGVAYWYGI